MKTKTLRQKIKPDTAERAEAAALMNIVVDLIDKRIEAGQTYLMLNWDLHRDAIPSVDFDTWTRLFDKYLTPLLEDWGCEIYNHEFSDADKLELGRKGYCTFKW